MLLANQGEERYKLIGYERHEVTFTLIFFSLSSKSDKKNDNFHTVVNAQSIKLARTV